MSFDKNKRQQKAVMDRDALILVVVVIAIITSGVVTAWRVYEGDLALAAVGAVSFMFFGCVLWWFWRK